jgi:5-methylcytosine-specific restriction endonuclease McrA
MIRIPVTSQELTRLIEREVPGWLERAARRTRQARQRKRFTGEGIWSEVKGVYMALQHHKCAYCERPMAEGSHANIEYDVEHFRPKSRVTPWPDAKTAKELRIRYKVRNGVAKGYPLLAHDPHNYVVTCKVCNSPLKADHFPIDGTPSEAGSDLAKLDADEKPLLLFPIGSTGPSPEELITFEGILPVPAKRSGHDRKRAQVTIDFFRLHLRTELRDARAHLLVMLWNNLERAQQGSSEQRQRARDVLVAARQNFFPHAACARAFLDLYARDPAKAEAYYLEAQRLMARKEPGLYKRGAAPRS